MSRMVAVIVAVVAVVVVIGGVGYWYVKQHQRISLASVQKQVASKEGAQGVVVYREGVARTALALRRDGGRVRQEHADLFQRRRRLAGQYHGRALKLNQCKDDASLQPALTG